MPDQKQLAATIGKTAVQEMQTSFSKINYKPLLGIVNK